METPPQRATRSDRADQIVQRFENGPMSRLSRRLAAGMILLLGLGCAIAGIGAEIRAASRTGGDVRVQVTARRHATLQAQVRLDGGQIRFANLAQGPQPASPPDHIGLRAIDQPVSSSLEAPTQWITLRAADSTLTEQLLSQAHLLVFGVCAALAALLLGRLLLSITAGAPFEPANARRLGGIGTLLFLGGLALSYLPALAAHAVLNRIGLGGPGDPLGASAHQLQSMLGVLALWVFGALSYAFRRGAELARETEGLV
jgi:hypothetical protein